MLGWNGSFVLGLSNMGLRIFIIGLALSAIMVMSLC